MRSSSQLQAPLKEYRFVARSGRRKAVVIGMFLSLIGFVAAGYLALNDGPRSSLIATGVLAFAVVAFWSMLGASLPHEVLVKGSVIEIRRDGQSHTFDLTDPGVDLRVSDGEIAFARYMDGWVVVTPREVDWKVFSDVVMHYQRSADHNAEARDQRFRR
jgi:hypothetical protein